MTRLSALDREAATRRLGQRYIASAMGAVLNDGNLSETCDKPWTSCPQLYPQFYPLLYSLLCFILFSLDTIHLRYIYIYIDELYREMQG